MNDYFEGLSDAQIQAFLYENDRENTLHYFEQQFSQLAQDTPFTVRQIAIEKINVYNNPPQIEAKLTQTLEELKKMDYEEIMELAKIENGYNYKLITAEGIDIYNFGVTFYLPFSSVLYNEEARIAVQAYIHFYDKNDEIERLSQIPDLMERVDKVIEDRLNHLQEEDHNLLRSNLHELILEETGADYSSVWVEVMKY